MCGNGERPGQSQDAQYVILYSQATRVHCSPSVLIVCKHWPFYHHSLSFSQTRGDEIRSRHQIYSNHYNSNPLETLRLSGPINAAALLIHLQTLLHLFIATTPPSDLLCADLKCAQTRSDEPPDAASLVNLQTLLRHLSITMS